MPVVPKYGDGTNVGSDYTEDQIEFFKAVERYKRENDRPYPTWSEVLSVLLKLGYQKVAQPIVHEDMGLYSEYSL